MVYTATAFSGQTWSIFGARFMASISLQGPLEGVLEATRAIRGPSCPAAAFCSAGPGIGQIMALICTAPAAGLPGCVRSGMWVFAQLTWLCRPEAAALMPLFLSMQTTIDCLWSTLCWQGSSKLHALMWSSCAAKEASHCWVADRAMCENRPIAKQEKAHARCCCELSQLHSSGDSAGGFVSYPAMRAAQDAPLTTSTLLLLCCQFRQPDATLPTVVGQLRLAHSAQTAPLAVLQSGVNWQDPAARPSTDSGHVLPP